MSRESPYQGLSPMLIWLLERFCHPDFLEEFRGDLEELHHLRMTGRYPGIAAMRTFFDGISLLRVHFRRQRTPVPFFLSPSMLRNYFIVAVRSLRRHVAFASINVIGLSLSMAVALILMLFIRQAGQKDEFHTNSDRTVRVYSDFKAAFNRDNGLYGTSPASLADLMETEVPGVEKVAHIREGFRGTLQYGDTGLPLRGLWADPAFFELFDFELASGDPATALAEPGSIVLSPTEARKFFGDEDPMGQTMSVVGNREYTVTGVLARDDYPTMFPLSALASYSTIASDPSISDFINRWYQSIYMSFTFALLEEDAVLEDVQERVRALIPTHFAEFEGNRLDDLIVQPLEEISLGVAMGNEMGTNLPREGAWFLLTLAAVILLTACFNYVGLTVSRSLKRAREVGVRKVFGAVRSHISSQFFIETIVVSSLSVLIAIVLLQWLVPAFNSFSFVSQTGLSLIIDWSGDPGLYAVLVVFTLTVAAIAGFYPSLFLSRFRPADAVKGLAGVSGGSGSRLRKGLVVVQFTISLVFLVTAVVMVRQAQFMQQGDYGFNTSNVVNVRLFDVPFERFRDRISQSANVELVSGMSVIPAMGSRSDVWVSRPGASDEDNVKAYQYAVEPDWVENLDLDLIAGRNVSADATYEESREVMVNETLLDKLDLGAPLGAIGQTFIMGDSTRVFIKGVLKDFHADDLSNEIAPYVFFYQPEMLSWANVRLVPSQLEAGMEDIRAAWLAMGHPRSVDMAEFETQLKENFVNLMIRDMYRLIGFIAFLAVTIACLGLLGIASFNVESRTREISIRKVLGADVRTLVVLLSREFIILIGVATVIALPLAWILTTNWLQGFAYRITLGPGTMGLALAILLAIAALAVGSQTLKASLANPIDNLHEN